MKNVLWWLIAGTRGGLNRARIIKALYDRPYNAYQLSEMLGLDYKTIKHHLKVLSENEIIKYVGDGYGAMYILSKVMLKNYAVFKEIWEKIENESN